MRFLTTAWQSSLLIVAFMSLFVVSSESHAATALQNVRERGYLSCGVRQDQAGFSMVDARGVYSGIEADLCHALSVAIFATPGHVRFMPVEYIQHFIDEPGIDVVFHGLTHTLERERRFDINFSSVYFYDGQAFMVPRSSGIRSMDQLRDKKVCLRGGGEAEKHARKYVQKHRFELIISVEETQAQDLFLAGRCTAYTADVSLMMSMVYSKPVNSAEYHILAQRISKEPLAAITRRSDRELSHVLNAVLAAMVEAEERGITAADVREGTKVDELASFTGWAAPFMPQLPNDWAIRVIRQVGNYGEIYNRNLAKASEYGIERGLNAPWNSGGLMYALPVR